MGFFSWLFRRPTEEQRATARRKEVEAAFPFLRPSPARDAEIDRQLREKYYGVPESAAPLDGEDERLAQKIKKLLFAASYHASRDARAFENLSRQMAEMGASIRAGGRGRWDRIERRVKVLCESHYVGLAQYYELLGSAPAAPPPPAEAAGSPATVAEGRRATSKPIVRLDEAARTNLPDELADVRILLGVLAEDAIGEALEDEDTRSIVVAPRALLLAQLPKTLERCSLEFHYPTERMGGLRASDPASVDAFSSFVSHELGGALKGQGGILPVVLCAPNPRTERIQVVAVWAGEGTVAGSDVLRFALALEDLLQASA